MTLWLMGLAAIWGAGMLAMYVVGFVHGRERERGMWSLERRAVKELRGRGPRVVKP